MNVGIIAEYNPFHNGHKYHLNLSKSLTNSEYAVVVMSGNFVQRGEPAICKKETRVKAALLNGADLVIELPVYYATAGADLFAFGAVDILNKSGIIDNMCFGSEEGNLETMLKISEILTKEDNNFKKIFKQEIDKGISYPKARQNALSITLNKNIDFLNNPNNILSIEYLKALKILKSNIKPYTIARKKAQFHSKEINGNIASATAIRTAIYNNKTELLKKCIPENIVNDIISEILLSKPSINSYTQILQYILRTKTAEYISKISDITEGLENRIIKNSNQSLITDIIEKTKTKRYTYSKIQRALIHIILDIKKSDINFYQINGGIPYIRVLGFKKESVSILNELIKKSIVPVITNIPKATKILENNALKMLNAEIKSTDIYYMLSSLEIGKEYKNPIVVI